MIVINFSHRLTPAQLEQINTLAKLEQINARANPPTVDRIIDVPSQIDMQSPLAAQAEALANAAGLTADQWQGDPIIINPPALSSSAAALLAHLHGRMGYFPPCLRMRQVPGSVPPQFEVAEILDLQGIRQAARGLR